MSRIKPQHLRFCQSSTKKGHQCKLHCQQGFTFCHVHIPKTQCDICMMDNVPLNKYVELPCKHCLCVTCLNKWKMSGNNTCPFCRKIIVNTMSECIYILQCLMDECANTYEMHLQVKVIDKIFNVLSTTNGQELIHNNCRFKNVVCMKLQEYDRKLKHTKHYEMVKVWEKVVS